MQIHLNIKSAEVNNMKEDTNVVFVWKRNNEHVKSKESIKLGPMNPTGNFKDEYLVKYTMTHEPEDMKISDKISKLYLQVEGDENNVLGSCEFNLGHYVG